MGTPDNKLSDLVDMVKSWIPHMTESPNVSRDFWMPDQSCRVCYECDSQFTVFNRKHHCRLCGRVFCAKCTSNAIPLPSHDAKQCRDDWARVRVCNYCFNQWEQGLSTVDNGTHVPTPRLSPSPSTTSLSSSKSSSTYLSSSSTLGSVSNSPRGHQHLPCNSVHSSYKSALMDPVMELESVAAESKRNCSAVAPDSSSNHFHFCFNRSDEDDDECSAYPSDTDARHYSHVNDCYDEVNMHDIHHVYGPEEFHAEGDNAETKTESCSLSPQNYDTKSVDAIHEIGKDADYHDQGDGSEISPFEVESEIAEPVDFENNGLLWLPPEPEDEEDEKEAGLSDGDDEGATDDCGYLCTSNSFGSGEYRKKDKSCEEHRKAMKYAVEGHFRALVSQLLLVENLPVGDENDKENWLEIITSLSWEAATLLKPDTSKSAGMDPGGYVKVKCIGCGRRRESMVVKGVVCKKNVAHRRMTSKIEKPRFLILGGALEYQRVYNTFSSFDTLLQQEMDHLKMAIAKIDAHHPNLLLVEKSVSRYAQEYLLAKDISLVLNIKRTLLVRLARCTGAQIVPSIDHLTSQKLGYCDIFHVERFFEEHGSAGQGGKKLTKTLMFFEGCPKRLGCTILLKGAHGDELKKVKHVIQYAIFAAYHLGLETSFLADEGASLPQLPLTSPITVALPNKAPNIERSISTFPVISVPSSGEFPAECLKTNRTSSMPIDFMSDLLASDQISNSDLSCSENKTTPGPCITNPTSNNFPPGITFKKNDIKAPVDSLQDERDENRGSVMEDNFYSDPSHASEHLTQAVCDNNANGTLGTSGTENSNLPLSKQGINGEGTGAKEDFSLSPSDNQSILVFLSTRCVWSGTVCEPSHHLRIQYYGSCDKPLGRFLRDQLFDQNYCCNSCKKPSEAHVHCYTHRQGSLTISVKRLSEILLPGEREGKIWMWHRCLRCPRENGFPPATLRVVMSDAAWGLSFGKFLELSFSNHAAASRVASCGHSLHRDCLRFYGFGRMVACFRYASIDLNSVYLPPATLRFSYDRQEWLKKEVNEVRNLTDSLFNEVRNALNQTSAKFLDEGMQSSIKATEFIYPIEELEGTLHKEREEFEELLKKAVCWGSKADQPAIDVLELNKLRRMIMFLSYVWDQRLIHAVTVIRSLLGDLRTSLSTLMRHISSSDKLSEMNVSVRSGKGCNSCDSFLQEEKREESDEEVGLTGETHEGQNADGESLNEKIELSMISGPNLSNVYDPLEGGLTVRRALSEGEYPINLSDTLEAAWTGESHPSSIALNENSFWTPETTALVPSISQLLASSKSVSEYFPIEASGSDELPFTSSSNLGLDTKWTGVPFADFCSSFNKIFPQIVSKFAEHIPVYITSMRELDCLSGSKLVLHPVVNDTVVPVYDDEPTSIVAHALVSVEYYAQMSEYERDSSVSLPLLDPTNLLSFNSFDESITEAYKSLGSFDDSFASTSGSRNSQGGYPGYFHARVNFMDNSPPGKVKYAVTCYYAKRFEALRRICCPSEIDFIRSISRCKKWGAKGGKSNVFFAKTLDDRFIIKQVTKTELESFIKFAPAYFKYLSESISSQSPTCLAKILGIYQVSSKHLKGGKETKMDILVMENLLFGRSVTRLYDLKGSSRSRYNPDPNESNAVLLDQNLIESMPTSPIFVGPKAKRLLGRAVWNDTGFLASVHVMDYSLLVGVDEQKHELVLGIIDFMRQYTWDKHLETWVKTSGILGGPKNASPTVISPQQYKKRFRKAMGAYFLMVAEWSSSTSHPTTSGSQSEVSDKP